MMEQPTVEESAKGARILIVEDESIIAHNVAGRLRELGYDIVGTITHGEDAVREATAQHPDVVLMDICLAGKMDGVTAAEQIRSRIDIPIIYLTGYADAATLQRAKVTEPFGYVLKPFEIRELHTAIEMALYKHGSERELHRYREHLEELVEERTTALAQEVAERRRAEEEAEHRAEELSTLNAFSRQISTSQSLEQITRIALAGIVHCVHPDLAMLYMRRGNELLLQGTYPSEAERTFNIPRIRRVGQCLCGLAAAAGRPLYAGDIRADARCTLDECKVAGMRSFAALPLLKGTEILGILGIASSQVDAFQGHVAFLETLAGDVTIGLQNVLLLEEAHLHNAQLEEAVVQRTRELQAERDRTRAILEAVGEAVMVTDVAGRILYVNPAMATLTGYSKNEILGQDAHQWLAEPPPEDFFARATEVLRTGQVWHDKVLGKRQDGALRDLAMSLAPLFDSDEPDQFVGTVCALADITPLKEAERLKDEFVSNVSHELRTPLSIITLISGNLDTLYDTLEDVRRRKMIRDMREQARVLDNLIGNVLEISRLDSGRVSRERHRVDLARLVREEVEKQQLLAAKKGLQLRASGCRSLPVWGNDDQLRQVVRNLVNNAIKYTGEGGTITCECCAPDEGATWEKDWPGSVDLPAGSWAGVRIVDTGIGIAPQDLPRLFERFYRVQAQGSVPGTGLGLAIAHELVALHRGHIAVASEPGKGSTFAVYLPIDDR
jgi:PAS domain S-box-containing protein